MGRRLVMSGFRSGRRSLEREFPENGLQVGTVGVLRGREGRGLLLPSIGESDRPADLWFTKRFTSSRFTKLHEKSLSQLIAAKGFIKGGRPDLNRHPRSTIWCSNQLSYTHHGLQTVNILTTLRGVNPAVPCVGAVRASCTLLMYKRLVNRRGEVLLGRRPRRYKPGKGGSQGWH